MNKLPISICIPTFNRREMLREAIDSVFVQHCHDYELVISDNGSTDGTPEMVAPLMAPCAKFVRLPENLGACRNAFSCISESSGDWILFLHDDDLLVPGSLQLVRDLLLACTDYTVMLPSSVPWDHNVSPFDNCLRFLNGISPCSTLYRREFLMKYCTLDNDCGDWEVLVMATLKGYKIGFYDFNYIIRRDHPGQESKRIIRDGSGNRSMAGFAAKLCDLIPMPEWEAICTRIGERWTSLELMTLGRFIHSAQRMEHYQVLRNAAAARGKWRWASAKGFAILAETLFGPVMGAWVLKLAKHARSAMVSVLVPIKRAL